MTLIHPRDIKPGTTIKLGWLCVDVAHVKYEDGNVAGGLMQLDPCWKVFRVGDGKLELTLYDSDHVEVVSGASAD